MLKFQQKVMIMEKYFGILQRCPLFAGVADDELAAALDNLGARVVSCGKRQTILSEGETIRFIGIVLSGTVQIVRVDYYGNRSILSNIEPSELFGESFACAGVKSMPVSVVTTDGAEILLLDHKKLIGGNDEYSQGLLYNLIKVLAQKNIDFNRRIEITSKRTTREKLMAYLMWQAKRNDSSSFTIPFDRQELADYLEVERSGLSAEIGRLRREGVIKSERSRFELL